MERIKLPSSVVNQIDLARLLRELNGLEDFFNGVKVRASGTSMQLPRLSRQLDQLSKDNQVNLMDETQRHKLSITLQNIYDKAPKLHISFASEPTIRAFDEILTWIRTNIHPHALVQVGLQPAIAAGCVLRTPNRIFDMSLRKHLKEQEPYMAQLIKGAMDGSR